MSDKPAERQRTDTVLFWVISLLLLSALGIIYKGWSYTNAREEIMTQRYMEYALDVLNARLEAFADRHERTLESLSVQVNAADSVDPHLFMDRWRADMRTSPDLVAVRLADGTGDEFALIRDDPGMIFQNTERGSQDGPPLILSINEDPHDTTRARAWLGEVDHDPRKEVWFSQALRNGQANGIWSLDAGADSVDILHLSMLVRPISEGQPFHVIDLTIEPARLGSALFGGLHRDLMDAFLFTSSNQMLSAHGTVRSDTALLRMLGELKNRSANAPLSVTLDHSELQCRVRPFALNGATMQAGVVISSASAKEQLLAARIILICSIVVIVALIVLLVWAYLRKRADLDKLRAQRKRTKQQQQKLAKALGERDVLDREVHHRVKNNLQVVSSLLNLQAKQLDDGPVKEEFIRGKRRIDFMALVHHKLYGLTDLRGIDLQSFFQDLVSSLSAQNEPHSRGVSIAVNCAGIQCDPDTAIELGIILCELVTNCFQHAFPYSTGGHIDIGLDHVEGDLHRLVVKDNGTGMPKESQHTHGHLGLEIVEAMAGQLDGDFLMDSSNGMRFEVLFRMKAERPIGPA